MKKETLSNMREELHRRENNIYKELLEMNSLKQEMDDLKTSEARAVDLLCQYKRRIQELEAELNKRNESEANLYDSLVMQTKLLDQSKILLQESELEIASLREKLEELDGSTALLEEIGFLKNEVKLATEAEEKSKKAMDDLALALKEVATEANVLKERLESCQEKLEQSNAEKDSLKEKLRRREAKYEEFLEETKKEAGRYKNIADRLRSEAEESLQAWNGKEMEFVNCIKRVEFERSASQKETTKLLESIREEENKTKESKEENQRLRDILKQALNEANVAKEAAAIARGENAQLRESLAKKEEALNWLSQENEILKIHEAAAFENIKELNRLLAETSSMN